MKKQQLCDVESVNDCIFDLEAELKDASTPKFEI